MKHEVIVEPNTDKSVFAYSLAVGEMGIIVSSNEPVIGHILLKTYNCLVSLTAPNLTYTNYTGSMRVKRLKKGSVVKIIVGR